MFTSDTMYPAATAERSVPALADPPLTSPAESQVGPASLAWRRYRKLGWFCLKAALHLFWWDLLLNRPILGWVRTPASPRWRRLAGEFCTLASEMGGVLVKLGQFLSLRVDLLPRVVTEELALLQDQMPAVATTAILAAVEADLGCPVSQRFAWFEREPVASASMAQVHRARLPSGEHVVVKVLRPGVLAQFETDLALIARLVQGLEQIPRLRKTIDLDTVFAEFATVTRRELDTVVESQHIERFARDFAGDPQVHVPTVYEQGSGTQTLTLEDVGFLKINQVEAIAATGISRTEVAQQLTKIYLQQIFVTHFIHADPHPGNVFVKPLPHPDENRTHGFAPGEPVPYQAGRPFQIVLIDFGMATEIPPRARQWLREFVIGLGTRDAHRIVQAYLAGGMLRPGTDPARVEEMTAALLVNFQELLVGLMPDREQARPFFSEFEDLVHHYPFQIPVDLLFMFRALGIVSGLVKELDSDFDLTVAAEPFARQFLWQGWQEQWQSRLQALSTLGQMLVTPPLRLDELWSQAQELLPAQALTSLLTLPGQEPAKPCELSAHDRRTLQQLDQSVARLSWTLMAVCLLLAGVIWQMGGQVVQALAGLASQPDKSGWLLIGLAVVVLFWNWRRGT
jgi:predicted unusual protein kinase regulating ubiquinone biosynthesis (AarF/ABC1/UbiB family)